MNNRVDASFPQGRKRWLRFGLRGLLVAVALLTVPIAAYCGKMNYRKYTLHWPSDGCGEEGCDGGPHFDTFVLIEEFQGLEWLFTRCRYYQRGPSGYDWIRIGPSTRVIADETGTVTRIFQSSVEREPIWDMGAGTMRPEVILARESTPADEFEQALSRPEIRRAAAMLKSAHAAKQQGK